MPNPHVFTGDPFIHFNLIIAMLKQKKEKFEFPPSLQSELFNYLKPEQKE